MLNFQHGLEQLVLDKDAALRRAHELAHPPRPASE
jgi:hypothetical protein